MASHLLSFTSQITSTPPAAVPGIILHGYTKYLWNYEPNSWVAKLAYTSRVLALICILPVVILGVLDIVSYGIARTLGVIDDVKASTSDKAIVIAKGEIPIIYVTGERSPSESSSDQELAADQPVVEQGAAFLSASQPQAFYASESGSLKLAGADVFSPVASESPSPTMSRRNLPLEMEESRGEDEDMPRYGLRHRLA